MSSSTQRAHERFLLGSESVSATTELEAAVLNEMSAAWRAGRPSPAEFWLRQHPQLADRPEVGVRIVYEEFCLREELGETVDSAELLRRFPQWHDELQVVLSCHRLFDGDHAPPSFPEVPAQFGEFRLLKELDRGAAGRVYLATQPNLSDRMLVVKLTVCEGDEHLSLARLQHSHIVPLFLVQNFPEQNLRALVMPYLGGISWARALERLRAIPPAERTGQQVVDLLMTDASNELPALSTTGPAARFLSRGTYEQAVCWLGSCLADALGYAHQRGLAHLDVKPSNVLLAGDGQPMLLDFHLALSLADVSASPLQRLGGTRGYMSPEQQAASAALREGRPVAVNLDGRSDVFSLGTLLYESLTGQLPSADEVESRSTLRRKNPSISRGLEDVVHKCLSRRPDDRYSDAGALAADLRRHLADLPLAGVPNRSLKERWQKWRRRRPHAAALLLLGLVACLAVGGGLVLFGNEQTKSARAALERADRQLEQRQYQLASEQLAAGLRSLYFVPGRSDLKAALHAKLAQSQQAVLAQALHVLVERLRLVDSFEGVTTRKLQQLEAGCAAVWSSRAKILQSAGGLSDAASGERVRVDLLDLSLLWTELQIRLAAPGRQVTVRAAALERLNELEQLIGPSHMIELARQEYGRVAMAEASPTVSSNLAPRTAWEHFLTGRWLFRDDQIEGAKQAFQRAIELEPGSFWPHCYLSLCDYRLGQYEAAVSAATVSVALAPENAACYYNRALAEQASGQRDTALHDFDKALRLDPTLGTALVRRGILLTDMNRYPAALADFEAALSAGEDPALVHFQIARWQLAKHDRPAARASLRKALQCDETYVPAQQLLSTLEGSP